MANFDDSIVLEGESSSDVFGNWKPISRTDTHVKKIAEFGVKEHEQTMIFNQVEAGLVGNRMLMDNEKYYILVILAQNSPLGMQRFYSIIVLETTASKKLINFVPLP